jgi:signal transduction histidine kinase
MKATLLTAANQELRIPLTVIKGCTATLLQHERRLLRAEQREFLWTIDSATDQMEVALDYLAGLATLETEQLVLCRVPINLVRVVRQSIKTVVEKHAGQQKPRRVIYRVRHIGDSARRTPPRYLVRADSYWLSNAIHFLLESATLQKLEEEGVDVLFCAFTDDQPRLVGTSPRLNYSNYNMVAARSLPSSGQGTRQCVLMTIRCASPSASRTEHADHTGAQFAQLDPAGGYEVTDLGLGYVLCQRIMQLHGGELRVESGNGSEPSTAARGAFHVILPIEGGTPWSSAGMGREGYAREKGDDSRRR